MVKKNGCKKITENLGKNKLKTVWQVAEEVVEKIGTKAVEKVVQKWNAGRT